MTTTADPTRPLMADLPEPVTATAGPQEAALSRPARPRLRDQIADNPLLTLFGTFTTLFGAVIVALLVFAVGTINLRIDDVHDRIDDIHDRIDETNDRIDETNDRIVRLEDRVINIDLKLTALIAALNATEAVDAALEGRLLEQGVAEQDQTPVER